MKAVALAAGEGTRLRPLTEDKPKGMVDIDDAPILAHCFEQLANLSADEFPDRVSGLTNRIEVYRDKYGADSLADTNILNLLCRGTPLRPHNYSEEILLLYLLSDQIGSKIL